jgi:cell division protein FtsL
MKKLFRLLIIFIFLFTTSHSKVYAQKKSRQLRKADQALNLEKYSDAIQFYKKAYKKN